MVRWFCYGRHRQTIQQIGSLGANGRVQVSVSGFYRACDGVAVTSGCRIINGAQRHGGDRLGSRADVNVWFELATGIRSPSCGSAPQSMGLDQDTISIQERSVRVQIILNPQANHGRAIELREQLLAWGSQYGGVDVAVSAAPGHARQLAEEAVRAGYDLVAAAGGDGTVQEVVNGLVHDGRGLAMLGIIPIGSGNDYAHGLSLVTDPRSALDRLLNGRARTIDLARIEDDKGRYVLVNNAIGIGFDAMVTIQSQSITSFHGFAMYTVAALRTILLHYDMPHLVLRYDEARAEQDVLMVSIGIGPRAGGGFYLTPHALYDDNLLDSCTVNPVGRLTMLWMLPRVMRGTHITSRHVTMRRSNTIEVLSDRPLPIHIDGEIFAYPHDAVRRVTINSLPGALQVMVDEPSIGKSNNRV